MGAEVDSLRRWTDEELASHLGVVSQHFIELLDSHMRHLEEAQRDSWGDVYESNSTPFTATPAATFLTVQPQSENRVRIDQIVAFVGVGAGSLGIIELGSTAIAIQTNQVVSIGGRWHLNNTDIRRISTSSLSGPFPLAPMGGSVGWFYLGLFGKEIPRERLRW